MNIKAKKNTSYGGRIWHTITKVIHGRIRHINTGEDESGARRRTCAARTLRWPLRAQEPGQADGGQGLVEAGGRLPQ